jgi:FKBP-type peptidyl-prolyl cis-trans isomerase (trigger factor)
MKTEFIDVSDTQKNLVVEIPSTVVDAEIDKVARDYSRAARVPGFRLAKSRRRSFVNGSAIRSCTMSRTA